MNIDEVISSNQVSSHELEKLLELREKNEVNFELIDIRENWEYAGQNIVGCDKLLPTSTFDKAIKELEKIKDKNIILYCRTGNRTGQALHILKRMGFKNVAHLTRGIVEYFGKTKEN